MKAASTDAKATSSTKTSRKKNEMNSNTQSIEVTSKKSLGENSDSQLRTSAKEINSDSDVNDLLTLEMVLPALKESLLFQKSLILNKTFEFKKLQANNVQLSDEAEVASNDLSNNLSIHLHERELKSLIEIEKALAKIENETYGQCESCSDIIHPKRLQARPLAALCIACMEELEAEKIHRINKQ